MSKKTSDNITDTEHDHGNIIIPRSDGKLHDLNVFANIAPDFAKDALRESPKIKPTTSLGPLEDHDHDHEHRPISVRRSDGLTHDIVQVFKAFSDPNGDSLRLIPSTKVDEGIRRSTLGKLDMQNIIKSSGRLPLPPQINTFNPSSIRIVHMSDTLNFLNKSSNYNNFLPPGDILIHSGNFTNTGSDEEFDTFDKWLKSVANIYHYRVVVLGSRDVIKIGNNWTIAKSMLPSATHVLSHSEATILGLRIYGMPWHWGHDANYLLKAGVPDSNRLNDIPDKVDILVTHGPAYGRLDTVVLDSPSPKTVKGDSLLQEEHWGSQPLVETISRTRPSVHLHGYVRAARGVAKSFGHLPLTLNSSMTDPDGKVLYAVPQVVKGTLMYTSEPGADATVPRQKLWEFSLDSFVT